MRRMLQIGGQHQHTSRRAGHDILTDLQEGLARDAVDSIRIDLHHTPSENANGGTLSGWPGITH